MKRTLFLLTAMLLCVSIDSIAQQQPPLRIAFVNSEKILAELPEAQQIRVELESRVKLYQDSLEQMGRAFQEQYDNYQKKQALMDPKAKSDLEKSLQDMQLQIREFQYQKFDTREGEIAQLREQLFAPVQDKVLNAIAQVAKEDGFAYVLDKMENATIVLYADQKYDITYKVIDRLKRGGTKPQ
ncbi:MAG TPA: OmpH family outer membrane protein [Bacteroidota bacterium]|nr:OmpH family outer membrane protein [Bacteroidota bacterium]